MKEVAPAPPPECNWSGFYIGINAGYAWMDTEVSDLDFLNVGPPVQSFSFDPNGPVAGGQVGYNFQPLRWLVLGVEGDAGYLGVDGIKTQPGSRCGLTFAAMKLLTCTSVKRATFASAFMMTATLCAPA